MVINPTHLAQTTRASVNWQDASRRAILSYRAWQRSAPEIVKTYALNVPLSAVRAKIRQEFERHRYVQQLPVADMLITKSNMEYQETLNYWKQIPHIMKYFRVEEDPKARVSSNFMNNFLEGRN
ncbi:uncharacterized protein LAJ45_06075 [Morchella importuna]|uniref:NADH dehydrogenase, alpha subcomplex, subunit 6 n=1 Tax=Morchella conica CCBAS932 TaxID=1392247 RepID=A0A3N4KZT8_9PEZI|nr:uncharacterized protein LAJ45_06075 [Morchella importuna]KAH8149923.1 hypothetical protein LAJ45_06075 [Morchella importuna]RPB16083.1 NADH dehydrogenase, alpha subcomplex, subunit 6 [Morchella conica CCBAS932]